MRFTQNVVNYKKKWSFGPFSLIWCGHIYLLLLFFLMKTKANGVHTFQSLFSLSQNVYASESFSMSNQTRNPPIIPLANCVCVCVEI